MIKMNIKFFRLRLFFIYLIAFIVFYNSAYAQTSRMTATDGYTPSALASNMPDVNPYNGSLNFSLPLLNVKGRGDTAHTVMLPINQYWELGTYMANPTLNYRSYLREYIPAGFGPLPIGQRYGPGFLKGRKVGIPLYCEGNYQHTYTNLMMMLPNGSEVVLRDKLTQGLPGNGQENCGGNPGISRGNIFVSTDSTGIRFVSDNEIRDAGGDGTVALNGYEEFYPSGELFFPNGTRYRVNNGLVVWIKDRNGNVFYFTYNDTVLNLHWRSLTQIRDSLNRTVDIEYLPNEDQITYKGFGEVTQTIRVLKSHLSTALRPGEVLRKYGGYGGLFPEITGSQTWFNPLLTTSVILPNGQSYQFNYNSYGELAKIATPTGVTYEYDWAAGTLNTPASGSINHYGVYRRVIESRIYIDGINLERRTTFSRPESFQPPYYYNNAGYVKVETFSANNERISASKHYYEGSPVSSLSPSYNRWTQWQEGREFKTEIFATDGVTLLKRVLSEFVNKTEPMYDTRLAKQVSITIENGNALAVMKKTEYDEAGSSDPDYFSHLSVKRSKAYNYKVLELNTAQNGTIETIAGMFAESDLVSVSETDYLYNANYKTRGIIRLPIETRVINPTNPTEVLAKSQVVYDEQNQYYSMVDYGSTVGYEALTGAYAYLRGNATTYRTWFADENRWIETQAQFDNFGNNLKVWDMSIDTTRFVETEYSPLHYFAYPTKITAPSPDPTGTHGMTETSSVSTTYDFWTGKPLTVTDANGQTATLEYDALMRVKKVIPPAGDAISENIYEDTPGNLYIKTRTQIDSQNWAESTVYFDGLGRAFKTQTKDTQGNVFTETEYDGNYVKRVSNPYRQGEQKMWSKPRYDFAGRVVETYAPAPDGQTGASLGVVQFGISTVPGLIGPYVEAVDASGRKSRSISNIYGIARIDEATGVGGTADGDLGTIENPHQPTFYSYNIKGQLIKITQGNPAQAGQPIQRRYFMYDSFGRLIRVRQPEQTPNFNLNTSGNPENNQWTAAYAYDILGNVVRMTDAKGVNIINEYDKARRAISRCYTKPSIQTTKTQCSQLSSSEVSEDTPQADYYYDGKGLPQAPDFSRGALTKVTNTISEDYYTAFDNHGRVLASRQVTDGNNYDFEYKYNLSGGLVEQKYPSGRIVKTFLDADGGLASVSTKAANGIMKTVAANFDYAASGAIKKMMLGNGLWETAQYNERFQLERIGLGNTATNNNLFQTNYEYGELSEDGTDVETAKNTGSIARQTTTIPNLSFTQTYRYDALNRLTEAKEKAASGAENWKQTFGYDRFGNRTNFYEKVGATVTPMTNINHPTIDPTKNRFTTGQGYEYDYNGNLVRDAEGREFKFNGDDKQIEVKPADNPNASPIGKYYYDAGGNRVKKVTNLETTLFVYYGGGMLVAEYSTQTNPNPTTSYLTTDHLGSPRVITDRSGNVISRRDFMPFGEELGAGIGGRSEIQKYSALGADNIRKRFTGYEKDAETLLDFAEARMYQNKHGRFTAVDPLLASASPDKPQTFNRYVYVSNNPINSTDPTGLCEIGNKENGKPCTNFSGQVYTHPKGGFTDTNCRGCTPYNSPAITVSAYGVNYRITGGASGGWEQMGPNETVQSEPANDDLVEAGGGGISNSISLPGGFSGTTNNPLMTGSGGGVNNGVDYLPAIEQGDNPLDAPLETIDNVATVVGFIPVLGEVADGVSLTVSVIRGDKEGFLLSAGAMIPFFGNVAGAAKIARKLNKLTDFVNGNSKLSTKTQHLYEVFETSTGNVVKTGVSDGKITKTGKSYRATSQVNSWNKAEGAGKYNSRIVLSLPRGPRARENILKLEKVNANKRRKTLLEKFHKKP